MTRCTPKWPFYLKLMDKYELENWQKIKETMEENGTTDNMFYKRAVAICSGKDDPIEPLEPLK